MPFALRLYVKIVSKVLHSLWISLQHLCYIIEDAKATELIDEIFRRNSEGKEKEDLLQELEDERLDLLLVKGNTNFFTCC